MEFLEKWYGILAFVAFDVLALTLVAAISYRWFFKRFLDILVSSFCLMLTSPIFLVLAIKGNGLKKRGETESVLETETVIGKKGKEIKLHTFLEEVSGKWLKRLPYLADIFCGRLSFIGCARFYEEDVAYLDDEAYERFSVRPGLINPLVCSGDKDTTYEEMLNSDKKYAWNFGLMKDVKIFFAWVLKKIRGEGDEYLGETRYATYAETQR